MSGTAPIVKFSLNILKVFGLVLGAIIILSVLTEYLTQPLAPADNFWLRNGEFWLQVGTNMIIFIGFVMVSVMVIMMFSGRFVRIIYGLNSTGQGISNVIRLVFGKIGFGPYALIKGGQITVGQDSVVTKIGGPAGLVIHNDSAVVLQKRGKLTSALGSGFPLPVLEPFEKIYDVVDLCPKRAFLPVAAMTKEGIPVTWDVEICYQIDHGGQQSTDETPFPFSEDAVFKAATGKWRREMGGVQNMDWEGWIVGQTEGTLRTIIARRKLDELVGIAGESIMAAREATQQELTTEIREIAPNVGATLSEIRLQTLSVDDEVTEQRIETWQAEWQNWSSDTLAREEIERIPLLEKAKALAHIEGLVAVTEELEKLEGDEREVALMRLTSVLDQGTMGADSFVFFPGQAVELLERILGSTDSSQAEGNHDRSDKGDGRDSVKEDVTPEAGSDPMSRSAIPSSDCSPQVPTKNTPLTSDSENRILFELPIIHEIAAGQKIPISHQDKIGYIRQIGEFEFEFEGQSLALNLLRGKSQIKFPEEYSFVAVKISGDSMNDADIYPGDYVILQGREGVMPLSPKSRDIVTVLFHNEDDGTHSTLKRIIMDERGITFKPENSNPKYKPQTVSRAAFGGDSPVVEIAGIAIAVLKPKPIAETPS